MASETDLELGRLCRPVLAPPDPLLVLFSASVPLSLSDEYDIVLECRRRGGDLGGFNDDDSLLSETLRFLC